MKHICGAWTMKRTCDVSIKSPVHLNVWVRCADYGTNYLVKDYTGDTSVLCLCVHHKQSLYQNDDVTILSDEESCVYEVMFE